MKFVRTIAVAILISTVAKAQENSDVTNVTKITVLNPGLSYEHRVGKFQTLKLSGMMAVSFGYSYSSSMGSNAFFYMDPAAVLAYRYYYNFRNRESRGKRTAMNSLNYIGPIAQVIYTDVAIVENSYEEVNDRAVGLFGFVWGFQRNYNSRISLDLNLGLGYQFGNVTKYTQTTIVSKTAGTVVPVGELSLGFWLNKRKP